MKKKINKIVVIRLSAIGDVAMTVPVIWSLVKQYPELQVTFVSQAFAKDFIEEIPGVLFFQADTKGRHRGFWGIYRLFCDLRRIDRYDALVDLHNVIRSKILRFFFRLTSTRVRKIDKGRKEKRALCRIEGKKLVPLDPTTTRYKKVFNDLGLTIDDRFDYIFDNVLLPPKVLAVVGQKTMKWIGIAPFAKHKGKIYPLEYMERVMEMLTTNGKYKILLIGGGGDEQTLLEDWEKRFPNTVSLARKFSIKDELKIISNLDVLLAMDSANMHFASLVNTPVVSIWGATHPYAGFYGWKQNPDNALQVSLYCRPCSIYGNKPCFRKDYACLYQIAPEVVVSKVTSLLI